MAAFSNRPKRPYVRFSRAHPEQAKELSNLSKLTSLRARALKNCVADPQDKFKPLTDRQDKINSFLQ